MPRRNADHRANNFDVVRLAAAVSVIFSHSFLIAAGTQANEPFVILTGGQCVLGLVGVFVFFVISGYLVTGSFCRRPEPGRFALRRTLRIYPGLLVNVALCAFVLGPMVTQLSFSGYLAAPGLRHFLAAAATLDPGELTLPGVVFSHNAVGRHLNGSLWTLRYEALMYLMVAGLGVLRLLRLPTAIALIAVGMAAVYFEDALRPVGELWQWAWLLGPFAAGMALHLLRDRIVWSGGVALAALAALALFTALGRLILLFPLAGAYLVIWFCRRYDRRLDYSRWCGDLSYGIYIYGWPAEEFVMWLSGGRAAWWQVFLSSLFIVLPAAWLSWHLVEGRALRLARRPAVTPPADALPAPAALER
ncbi:MAG TPA: acyltransferase [Stellaceae bacterium]|nr:acyltransferase [Stellaceae bacterium]